MLVQGKGCRLAVRQLADHYGIPQTEGLCDTSLTITTRAMFSSVVVLPPCAEKAQGSYHRVSPHAQTVTAWFKEGVRQGRCVGSSG